MGSASTSPCGTPTAESDLLAGRDQAGRRDHHPARQSRRERRHSGHSRDVRGSLPRDRSRRTAGWPTRRTSPRTWCNAPASPRPEWMSLSHSTFRDLGAQTLIGLLVSHLGLPLMVKPQHGGSALGATAVRSPRNCPPRWSTPSPTARSWWSSNSSTASSWRSPWSRTRTAVEALPAVEISPNSGIFDYESRYTAGLTTYFTPARLTDEVAAAAADLAIGAHRALGLRDLSRTDAIATAGRRRAFPGGQRVPRARPRPRCCRCRWPRPAWTSAPSTPRLVERAIARGRY